MAAVFVVLFALVAVLRSPNSEEETNAVSRTNAETIRTFWEAYNRATDFRLAGDFDRAAKSYRDSLAIDPDHQDSLFYLATSLQAMGRYSEAVTVLRELTSLYPEHSRAWSQLGMVLATKAPGGVPDLDEAEAAFMRAQEINSEHTGPFIRRGQLALERGELEAARELFGIAADAGSPEGMFLAGLAAYLEGDFRAASGFFQDVLEKSAREAAITGRGASSEGDVEGELTPLDRARIRAEHFLYWTAHRLGGYPEDVPEAFRMERQSFETSFQRIRSTDNGVDGRGAFVDLDRDGEASPVVAGADGVRVAGGSVHAGAFWDVVPVDVDGDGWMDLYAIGSGYTGTGENALLRNERGRLGEVTEAWGLGGTRPTTGAVPADVDGDGKTDLLEVGNVSEDLEPVRLYLQRGGGFELAHRGLHYPAHAVDAAVADVDTDGKLDVFILGWKAPGRLFRNAGASFEDVTESSGLDSVGGDGFSALFSDFDADGDPDLLVTAHAPLELSLVRSTAGPTPRFFRNDGRGRFTDETSEVGLARSFGIMEAATADLDGDGLDDLVLALGGLDAFHREPSVVLRNQGGTFVPWALLPSPHEPHRALGVAVSGANVFLSGAGVFRKPR